MSCNDFRLFNQNEFHMLARLGGFQNTADLRSVYWEKMDVSYEHLDGNFVVCLIRHPITKKDDNDPGYYVWRGVSRRSKHDRPNRIKGEALAFRRAILHSRPVEI